MQEGIVALAIFVGAGATALIDVWAIVRRHVFGVARPGMARIQSLLTHAIFGVGMYVAAWLATL